MRALGGRGCVVVSGMGACGAEGFSGVWKVPAGVAVMGCVQMQALKGNRTLHYGYRLVNPRAYGLY